MIIKLSPDNLSDIAAQAAQKICQGGIVILPFDTVYGFACDPHDEKALKKIFHLKNRPDNKKMGLALDSIITAKQIGETDHWDFVESKAPGPYTFIIEARDMSLASDCYRDTSYAIRIPDAPLIIQIAALCHGLIAQTSSNISGGENCKNLADIKSQFSDFMLEEIDLIVDGGDLPGVASTIYDLTGNIPLKIER